MKKILVIVMTADQNYILQTRVAIWTMLHSAKENIFFKIHILCNMKLAQEDRDKIFQLEKQCNNIKIYFDEIEEEAFQNAKTTAYIPVASFYGLVISDMVDDEKCLFLDGDIIVNSDLSELYCTDLEGVYLAGVKDCCIQHDMERQASYKDVLAIPTMDNYINAGVLLMNLQLLRDHAMKEVFLSCMKVYYKMMDQDIMNKCCYGKIKWLELKFNFFADFYKRIYALENTSFSAKEIEDAKNYDGIIHFPGRYKPWNFIRMRGSDLWWERAKKALYPEDYDELWEHAVENTKKSDWGYSVERCRKADDIVIVGFSEIGKDTADSLERCGISNIRCFCDNNKEKQKMQYHNLAIYPVDEAYRKYPKALWVNTSQNSAGVISRQLMSAGVDEENILIYVYKSEQYYDNLDEQYQEYERGQLAFKQSGREC